MVKWNCARIVEADRRNGHPKRERGSSLQATILAAGVRLTRLDAARISGLLPR